MTASFPECQNLCVSVFLSMYRPAGVGKSGRNEKCMCLSASGRVVLALT